MAVIKTLKIRVKDRHAGLLRKMAREVNFVWNYCNELSCRSITERGRFLSAYDFQPYISGASKAFDHIRSDTIERTAFEFAQKRRAQKKVRLRWRKSKGTGRSLGWIPFKATGVKYHQGQIRFAGNYFGIWDSYNLTPETRLRAGSFVEDARGRWYFCVAVEFTGGAFGGTNMIGIDLGLKAAATCSDGTSLESRQYRALEDKLAVAQRAKNKNRVRAIHAKIKNRRRDEQHKFSTALVKRCSHIVVGNVSSGSLAKTKMAKSVYDAGWHSLKTMLEYKSQQAGIVYKEVNEAFSTQTCSSCGALSDSRPKGIAGLGIRHWKCCECGTSHDRDVNAAINILHAGVGCGPLVEEIAA